MAVQNTVHLKKTKKKTNPLRKSVQEKRTEKNPKRKVHVSLYILRARYIPCKVYTLFFDKSHTIFIPGTKINRKVGAENEST